MARKKTLCAESILRALVILRGRIMESDGHLAVTKVMSELKMNDQVIPACQELGILHKHGTRRWEWAGAEPSKEMAAAVLEIVQARLRAMNASYKLAKTPETPESLVKEPSESSEAQAPRVSDADKAGDWVEYLIEQVSALLDRVALLEEQIKARTAAASRTQVRSEQLTLLRN